MGIKFLRQKEYEGYLAPTERWVPSFCCIERRGGLSLKKCSSCECCEAVQERKNCTRSGMVTIERRVVMKVTSVMNVVSLP